MSVSRLALLLPWFGVMMLMIRCGNAQEPADGSAGAEQVMQKWIEFMTPAAEHELLKQRVGNWKVRMEMRTAPGATPTVSEGTATVSLVMGGRYIVDDTRSTIQGQDFQGHSITGFDKLKQKFVSVWIDNFGTGFTISSGTYDDDTKCFTYATMSPNIEAGDYKRTRTVERIVGPDQWVMEMYNTSADGQEFISLQAVYRRVTP
jgi:hypothetical protein